MRYSLPQANMMELNWSLYESYNVPVQAQIGFYATNIVICRSI